MLRQDALQRIFYQVAREDPVEAAALALAQPSIQAQSEMLGTVAGQWADWDLEGALAWVRQLPEGQGKETALSSMSYQWAQVDPEGMAAYAASLPPGQGK